MKAILVQPPFVQLNAPYPAVHYLETFLRGRGWEARAFDHSIALYRRVFTRRGLKAIFSRVRELGDSRAAGTARGEPGEFELMLSYQPVYEAWIDDICAFLSGRDPALAHRLASAVELPRGPRAQAFLAERGERISSEEARGLATRILDDLGDFIAAALDPDFGTVRYAERIASSRADFDSIRSALDGSWIMSECYRPFLDDFWRAEARGAAPDLILISIPFPGCLAGALECARSARRIFGGRSESGPVIVLGGGYISTELRDLRDTGIFDFCDYLAFDAGYGSLASIIAKEWGERGPEARAGGAGRTRAADSGLYKTMSRAEDGRLEAWGFEDGGAWGELEAEAVKGVFPDYASADFSAYLRIVDSTNPMHRLWSDSPWLKYGLAHGCYWRKCAFCDTELEYVADFARCDVEALMEAAGAAAARTGLSGIHFVDEAMPMASLLEFARLNRIRAAKEGDSRAFSFWGNVRFDASWTQDRCELLAASGLVAVSGGIEIATSRGLEMTDKGFDLKSLVRTLVAMRRAGLLVHAYLIYGFPGQDATDIVDSAEFCRQLFASGLVDSAFWHRFVLTRHSRMYAEWKAGGRPGLVPEDRPWSFANNDLGFEGEADFDVWDEPLASSLAAWMEGRGLDRPIGAWFRRGAPRPTIGKDLAEALIGEAEEALDGEGPKEEGTAVWVGGAPAAVRLGRGRSSLRWAYRGEMKNLELADRLAEKAAAILGDQGSRLDGRKFSELRTELGLGKPQLDELVSSGLLVV